MSKTFNISPLIFLLAGCGLSSEVPPIELPLGPPVSAGTVCVDVDQADARIVVNGQVATGRCTDTTTTYSSSVTVEITKQGFQTEIRDVSLLTAEPLELKVALKELPS